MRILLLLSTALALTVACAGADSILSTQRTEEAAPSITESEGIASVELGAASVRPLCPKVADPLAHASAYSLEVSADGSLGDGFFPMGFINGRQEPVAQAGFTMWNNFYGVGDYLNAPASATPDMSMVDEGHGFHFFSTFSDAGRLAERLRGLQKRNGGRPTPLATRYGLLPPALDPSGAPDKKAQNLVNPFDPATRRYLTEYAADYVKAGARDVPGRPSGDAIRVWGMDNEWEGQPDYSPQARAAFGPWLEKTYGGDIAGLDEAWRASFKTFAEAAQTRLPAPEDYAGNPGLFLDFWEFQTENFTGLVHEMARAMHDSDPLKRGVVLKSTQQTIEMPIVNRVRTFDHARFAELMRPVSGGLYGIDIYGNGDREAYETDYIYNCIRPEDRSPGYGVMYGETNNHNGPGHQFASTFWRMLANGAKSVMYFTGGFAGAKADWDKFGFLSAATGAPKAKFFYAARWASMVHRTEAFWEQSTPAAGLPRVALLMPRRDVLLSPPSEQDASKWAYGRDSRLAVFSWLREHGYWVDVIPYTKLTPSYLAAYDGLFLIGAEHLTAGECAAVKDYAESGGILVTDTQPGLYDEHHRERRQLDALLGWSGTARAGARRSFTADGAAFTAAGAVDARATTAREAAKSGEGRPLAFLVTAGKGRVLSFPFELGSLIMNRNGVTAADFIPAGPTADSGDARAYKGEFAFGRWLAGELDLAGLRPAYAPAGEWSPHFGRLRVEQPMTDGRGNVAVVAGNRALKEQEVLPPQAIELPLPGGPWRRALWAPAEDAGLHELTVRPADGGRWRIDLPEIRTAGVLYLFKDETPLIGVGPIQGAGTSVDGVTAKVRAGEPVTLRVQLTNAGEGGLAPGELRGLVPPGWTLAPAKLATPAVAAGDRWEAELTLTPVADDARLRPDWLYPVVLRWSAGGADRAIITVHVEGWPDPEKSLCLLSDNATYPATYPHRVATGLSYTYDTLAPETIHDPVRPPKGGEKNRALTNGYAYGGRAGTRYDAVYDTAVYVRYDTREVAVVFDLKAVRSVRRLVVVVGPGEVQPTSLRVLTGDDGKTWTLQAVLPVKRLNHEIVSPLFDARARYVRLEAAWPEPGGTLSEVELWGR